MGTLLRYLLDERELKSYSAFIGPFNEVAAELGLSGLQPAPSTLEAWYYGTRRPQNDSRRVLVNWFGHSIEQLWTEVPEGSVPAFPSLAGPARTHCPAEPGMDLNEMKRMGAMAIRRAREYVLGAERGRVGEDELGFLAEDVRRLVATYPRSPLADLWPDLVETQDRVFRFLEGGRVTPSQLRDLNVSAAVLSFLMAKGFHDMEDSAQAMTMTRVAHACAREAEHPGLVAMVDGLKSLIAYWSGRPGDALHYARQGAQTAPDRGTAGLWLLGLQARSAAVLGDEQTTRLAIRDATDRRDSVQPDQLDELGGLFTYSRQKQLYYEAESEVLLNNGGTELVERAQLAVEGFSDPDADDWAFGDLAGAQCALGLARLHGGDVDGTAEAIRPVLDLPPSYRSNGIVASARRVRHTLMSGPARDSVTAREIREEIEMYPPRRLALPQ
ncbi:hypothetical protein [Streptomyces sp. NBC_01506]|uniref:hypothetical protein n=1 Tax=Streptomyces sp. NBC_01506 TaxID=2903887 RepID=UPI003867AF4D